MQEKQVVEGVVKNITDYGAFVDLGGVDGLLHVTDIAWRRVSHPTEVLSVGQTVTVQIIKINHETQRISLGMKQLQTDPWEGVGAKYPVGAQVHGQGHQRHRLRRLRGAGAGRRRPGPCLAKCRGSRRTSPRPRSSRPGTEVDVQVLEVDSNKRRISPRPQADAGQSVGSLHRAIIRPASTIEGEIKSITEFGLFIGLDGDIDGMVHLSDLSWDKPGDEAVKDYEKGQIVKAKVLDVDAEKERVSLGIKQLGDDPIEKAGAGRRRSEEEPGRHRHGHRSQRRRHRGAACGRRQGLHPPLRSRTRPQRPAPRALRQVGDKVDALVTQVDKSSRKVSVSIKAREIAEEKEAVAQYGSSDSGASLGDILGAALKKRGGKKGEEE